MDKPLSPETLTAQARYDAGCKHLDGIGFPKDVAQAEVYFRLAAAMGHSDARAKLLAIVLDGRWKEHRTIEFLRNLADQGDDDAKHALGTLYHDGPRKAATAHRKQLAVEAGDADAQAVVRRKQAAAEAGDAAAQYDLGVMYEDGSGVAKDERQAVIWYTRAALQEYPNASYSLRYLANHELPLARQHLDAMVGGGDEKFALAEAYRRGQGVPQDDVEAYRWYRLAAERGHAGAERALGSGVVRAALAGTLNDPQALRRFRLVVEGSSGTELFGLAEAYKDGKVLPQDDAEAFRWYRLAAEQGHFGAQVNLAQSYLEGFGVPQDYELAHIWANRAVGHAPRDAREACVTLRDQAAEHFSPSEILALQKRAREWNEAAASATAPAPQNVGNAVPNLDGHPPPQTDSAAPPPPQRPAYSDAEFDHAMHRVQERVQPGVASAPIAGAPHVGYAGFWWRTGACLVDGVILYALGFVTGLAIYVGGLSMPEDWVPLALIVGLEGWLYYTLFECSTWQATVGKRMFSLRVTDEQGQRISFGRANGRYFSKTVSALVLFIGYLMVGLTDKKQGLHDKIASTLVLR